MKVIIKLELRELLDKEMAKRVPCDLLEKNIELVLFEQLSADALIESLNSNLMPLKNLIGR